MMKTGTSRVAAGCIAASMLLTACVTQPTQQGGTTSDDSCSAAGSALAGAVAGLLIGAMTGDSKRALAGAVGGGAIGAIACLVIRNHSRQVKSAAVVEQDYKRTKGALPTQPTLVSYQSRVDPSGTIRSNTDVRVSTNVEVVRGNATPVREVKEEIVLYDPQRKEFKRGSKVLSQGAGGSYETTWEFKLPTGITQGAYTVQTLMYVNGQMMAQRETTMQLVMHADGIHVAGLTN